MRVYFAGALAKERVSSPAGDCRPSKHLRIKGDGSKKAKALTMEEIKAALEAYGELEHFLHIPSKPNMWYCSFVDVSAAEAARTALHDQPCAALQGVRLEMLPYEAFDTADPEPAPGDAWPALSNGGLMDSSLHGQMPDMVESEACAPIPGMLLVHDFITEQEEAALMAYFESNPWIDTLKRRVAHYQHGFDYVARKVVGVFTDRKSVV